MRRRTGGRSPWRWLIAAIGLAFAGLSLPSVFEPLPDYAQHDTFELVMFYAVPLVVGAFGFGLAFIAVRSGVFVDEDELVVRPYAGVRSRYLAAGSLTAVMVKRYGYGTEAGSISPRPRTARPVASLTFRGDGVGRSPSWEPPCRLPQRQATAGLSLGCHRQRRRRNPRGSLSVAASCRE